MRLLALTLLAAAGLIASPAGASTAADRLAGTWVSAETLRALEAGRAVEVGCHLVVGVEPLAIEERCPEGRTEWGWLEVEEGRGTLEVRDGLRRLVIRAGTPNELELSRGGSLRRLYRVAPGQEELVAEWAMLPSAPVPEEAPEREVRAGGPEIGASVSMQREPIVPRSRFSCAAATAAPTIPVGLALAAGSWLLLRRRRGNGR